MTFSLTEKQQKEGCQIVRFGEIAKEVKLTTKNPTGDGLEHYIGLDHLDPQSLRIQRRGLISEDNPSFTRCFKPGQILFGKRRAYQKKAAVADFEGICSGDIIVIEAIKGKIIPELLPFIVQSDMFFDWAIKTSSGSLSPRTKWKALAEFEFPLPSLERQKEILEVLGEIEKISQSNYECQVSLLKLKIRLLYEFFSKPDKTPVLLGDLFEVQLGKMLSPKAKKGDSLKPYLRNTDIQWLAMNVKDLPFMNFDEKEQNKFNLITGDILMCEGGEIGRCSIWKNQLEDCYYQKALHRLRIKDKGIVLPEYAIYYFEYKFRYSNDFLSERGATTIAHLPRVKLVNLPISVHTITEQEKIIEIMSKIDKQSGHLLQRKIVIQSLKQKAYMEYIGGVE